MGNLSRCGFSVIELLVTLAIFGILSAIGISALRAPAHVAAANSVQGFFQDARVEAVKRNRAVAVIYDGGSRTFSMVTNTVGGATSCSANTDVVRTLDLDDDYGRVAAAVVLNGAGLLFIPSGSLRSCSSGVAAGASVVLSTASGARTVVVSQAGRVVTE